MEQIEFMSAMSTRSRLAVSACVLMLTAPLVAQQPITLALELAAIPSADVDGDARAQLLAYSTAHQWAIHPRTLNDTWITNGVSRYAELLSVEKQGGKLALQKALEDVAAGAMGYDATPLAKADSLNPLSPESQSMTRDKGAMIFHMLRWELGDKAFLAVLRSLQSQSAENPTGVIDLQKLAEAESGKPLTAFFAQWVDGTGAPQFSNTYTIYRLGNNKGFRTDGVIHQNIGSFRMPVELSIETDGKTEKQRIEIAGLDTHYTVNTFGRPRHIRIDPEGWVLKITPGLRARVAILKGQQLAAEGDLNGALAEYQKALEENPESTLANYRIGEVLFRQHSYPASVNAYRDALDGDGDPAWTKVWCHATLGKIYDLTGQRDRAVNEYQLAVKTNDNTQGAVSEAQHYLQEPYKRPENE
jgi:tetratricopeptide (TPR) repeat protein